MNHCEPDGTCAFMVENQYRIAARLKWMREPDWLIAANRDWRDHPETRWKPYDADVKPGDRVLLGRLDSDPLEGFMVNPDMLLYIDVETGALVQTAPVLYRIHLVERGALRFTPYGRWVVKQITLQELRDNGDPAETYPTTIYDPEARRTLSVEMKK